MYRPVIKEEDTFVTLDKQNMADFIFKNSDIHSTDIWEAITDGNLFDISGCSIIWSRSFFEKGKSLNEGAFKMVSDFAKKWVMAFYDAHPFLNRIVFK